MPIVPTAEEITILTPAAKASAEKFKALNPDVLAKFLAAEATMGEEVRALKPLLVPLTQITMGFLRSTNTLISKR